MKKLILTGVFKNTVLSLDRTAKKLEKSNYMLEEGIKLMTK